MIIRVLLLGVCCCLTAASGQWLDTVISSGGCAALCYDPVDNKVYCSWNVTGALVVIDGATNQRITSIPNAGGGPLLYNPAANAVHSGMYWDSTVAVVDCSSDVVIARPHINGPPKVLCYMPSSYYPVVACACDLAGKVVIVDAQRHIVVGELDVGSGPQSMCWDKHMDRLFIANAWDSTVTVARGEVGRDIWFVEATLNVGRNPCGLCFDSTDDKAYCGADSQGVAVINSSLLVTHVVTGHRSTPACYDPRRDMLYCTDAEFPTGSTMSVIDCRVDTVAATIAVGNGPRLAYYNSINNKVYCVNDEGSVTVINAATNHVVVTIPIDSNPRAIAWNTAQNRTYVACANSIYVIRDSIPSGVEESHKPQASSSKPAATFMRRLPADAEAFDATGRRVSNPKPGIYFVREAQGRVRAVKKVLIAR